MKTRHSIIGLLAFAFIAAVAGEAWAACTGSNRIDHSDAECLHGWWDNNSWPRESTFGAQNLCPDWGTVVAKVDIAGTSDRTWHLANGDKRRGRTSFTVRDMVKGWAGSLSRACPTLLNEAAGHERRS